MAMEIRRKTVVISPIRNRFFGEMKPPFRRYGETKKPVTVLIIFVNIWLLRFWAICLIIGVFTANVRLVDSNAILRGLLTHYFLTWYSVMRDFVWGMRIKGVYQNWRSPEVQRFCHYYNDTLLSGTYVFDWTSVLPDFSNYDTPSYRSYIARV